MKLTIVGSGRAAWAFASIWTRSGRSVDSVITRRDPAPAFTEMLAIPRRELDPSAFRRAELLLFAVGDGSIRDAYETVRRAIPDEAFLFHPSGSLSSRVFEHPNRFSLHPLQSLGPPGERELDFSGTLFTWEGTSSTRRIAVEMTRVAGGEFRAIETEKKVLYHAAAVFGANYVAAVLHESARLMDEAGVADSERALENLAVSAIRNWSRHRGRDRFTGPIARGEVDVVKRHLDALDRSSSQGKAYSLLATILIDALSPESGDPNLHALRELIDDEKRS
ncbi:MAG: DUF2520 domain-containing protein [Thermoanaerobaculia bacterium]|nr:DUF2520 domain-containing protein [Thermoanaerobaculia bacterium]